MDLVTSDKESDSKEDVIPIHRKRGLKSSMLITAGASILCNIVWPHRLSMGLQARRLFMSR